MSLVRLEVFYLRNLRHASLHFDPSLNLILGPNASGKTSLLEAIYLLFRARSFRTSQSTEVITHGSAWMAVAGKVLHEGREISVGVGLQGKKRQIKLEDKVVKARAELLQVLPVQFIDPSLHTLFEDAPKLRRKLLDWGVFYAEPKFLPAWRCYQRVLEQRNAALRNGDAEAAKLWGRELMKYGKIIEICRSRYLESLHSEFGQVSHRLGVGQEIELRYLPGRAEDKDLEAAIADDLERDLRLGCTQSGPHRDDFMAYVAGRPVCRFFSRGQMKLLAYALILAQLRRLGRTACLLIDDLASELDLRNQALLTELLVQLKAQVFVTATRPQGLGGLSPAARIFQAADGVIQAI